MVIHPRVGDSTPLSPMRLKIEGIRWLQLQHWHWSNVARVDYSFACSRVLPIPRSSCVLCHRARARCETSISYLGEMRSKNRNLTCCWYPNFNKQTNKQTKERAEKSTFVHLQLLTWWQQNKISQPCSAPLISPASPYHSNHHQTAHAHVF